ncbi:MAG: hypothetical protein WDN02_14895 [Methylovirgula sp.]|uniref:hypothetical protein n=1 Tax=Methylovirgula sp. TaxID=1978224 RepID=UPI0030765C74
MMLRRESLPRLLSKTEAAAYCGVGAATFTAHCPVRPVALGPSKRLERFDRTALNEWIDRLAGGDDVESRDWLAEMDGHNDGRSR